MVERTNLRTVHNNSCSSLPVDVPYHRLLILFKRGKPSPSSDDIPQQWNELTPASLCGSRKSRFEPWPGSMKKGSLHCPFVFSEKNASPSRLLSELLASTPQDTVLECTVQPGRIYGRGGIPHSIPLSKDQEKCERWEHRGDSCRAYRQAYNGRSIASS
jgi:hypothetical protein